MKAQWVAAWRHEDNGYGRYGYGGRAVRYQISILDPGPGWTAHRGLTHPQAHRLIAQWRLQDDRTDVTTAPQDGR